MKLMSGDSVGIKLLRDALFVGLLHDDRKLTPTKVGDWLDDYEGELSDLLSSVFEALASSLPGASSFTVDSEDEEDEGK
jgi:DNA-binding transcriptional LysR family regulator